MSIACISGIDVAYRPSEHSSAPAILVSRQSGSVSRGRAFEVDKPSLSIRLILKTTGKQNVANMHASPKTGRNALQPSLQLYIAVMIVAASLTGCTEAYSSRFPHHAHLLASV